MGVMQADELENMIGTEVGVSEWITVFQSMIDAFADVTMDHQFIHVDVARAKAETALGGTIAHGFLTLSLASKMFESLPDISGRKMNLNYGCDKLRFLAPVPSGSRIRGHFTLKNTTWKNDKQLLLTHELSIEIENADKPALITQWLGLSMF